MSCSIVFPGNNGITVALGYRLFFLIKERDPCHFSLIVDVTNHMRVSEFSVELRFVVLIQPLFIKPGVLIEVLAVKAADTAQDRDAVSVCSVIPFSA